MVHAFSTTAPLPEPIKGAESIRRLLQGETLANIQKIPPERLEERFALACDRVDQDDFEGGLDTLAPLVMCEPYDFRFQFGFALCLQHLGRTEDALKHFGLAFLLDPDDAGCAFRLGECHATLGNKEVAAEAFEVAISNCEPPTPNPDVRLACEDALSRLNQ